MMKRAKWAVVAMGSALMAGALGVMAQSAPVNAAPPAPPAQPAQPEKEVASVGVGSLTVDGLLQGWYQFTDGATPEDTFRLRRAEIRLSGEITPTVPWSVMVDPAQVRDDDTRSSDINGTNYVTSVGRKSVLQDFLITFKTCPYSSVDVGQYKVPFGMEGLESSAKLDLIERSMVSSLLRWADYRDVGVTCKGDLSIGDVKIQPAVGIYNGEGQNRLDGNNAMAYAGRLVVKPVESVHLGVAHYSGERGVAETDDNRTGVEAKITLAPVTVYGEYATGESDGKDKETYYATVVCDLGDTCQAVARYDWYDPDKDAADDAMDETSVGLNHFIRKHNAKLAVNYVFRGEEGASVDNDIVRVLAQVSF